MPVWGTGRDTVGVYPQLLQWFWNEGEAHVSSSVGRPIPWPAKLSDINTGGEEGFVYQASLVRQAGCYRMYSIDRLAIRALSGGTSGSTLGTCGYPTWGTVSSVAIGSGSDFLQFDLPTTMYTKGGSLCGVWNEWQVPKLYILCVALPQERHVQQDMDVDYCVDIWAYTEDDGGEAAWAHMTNYARGDDFYSYGQNISTVTGEDDGWRFGG